MKIARYLLVGGIAAAADLGIFAACVKGFQLNLFVVAPVSFLIATAINYLLSIRYVFESEVRFKKRLEVTLVFVVSSIGLAINQLALWLFIKVENSDEVLAKLMATGIVFTWNYTARNKYIFK